VTEDIRAQKIYTRPCAEETQETLRRLFSEVQIGNTAEFHIKHPLDLAQTTNQ